MRLENCILYKKDSCPFCVRVLRFMKNANITCEMKDVETDPKNKDELIKIGGKSQVPCLVIDGEPMYESLSIIQYMNSKL